MREKQEGEPEWERINSSLDRFKVPGGYLYRAVTFNSYALEYVPDVDLARYQAHMRDAYKKGYADGLEEGKLHN